jgi:hypothetical protein
LGVTPGQFDYIGDLGQIIHGLLNTHADLFQADSLIWWRNISIVLCIIYGIKWGAKGADLWEIVKFIAILVFTRFLLTHYATPLPWGGKSFRDFLPEIGREIASQINLSIADTLGQAINTAWANTSAPAIWQPSEEIDYFLVFGVLSIMQTIMFLISSVGMIMTAILGLFGRIGIVFLMVPRLSFLFWGWLSEILSFSFYLPMGMAWAFIYATLNLNILTRNFGTDFASADYSMARWHNILMPLLGVQVAMFLVIPLMYFSISRWMGGANAGGGFASTVVRIITRRGK